MKAERYKLPTLNLHARNLYGTIRYFPNCDLSRAFVRIGGKSTLTLVDINTLKRAGFSFRVHDEKGGICEV